MHRCKKDSNNKQQQTYQDQYYQYTTNKKPEQRHKITTPMAKQSDLDHNNGERWRQTITNDWYAACILRRIHVVTSFIANKRDIEVEIKYN